MKPLFTQFIKHVLLVSVAVALVAGCGSVAYREGRNLAADGNLEAAVPRLRAAVDEAPNNPEHRASYLRTRDQFLQRLLEQAVLARSSGQPAEAERLYRRLLQADPNHARAKDGLAELGRDARHAALLTEVDAALKAQNFELATVKVRTVLAESPEHTKALEIRRVLDDRASQQGITPQLAAALQKPITIEFKDAPLRQIFEILARSSSLNFVFDKDVKGDQRSTVFLRNSSIQNALNLVLLTNQLEQRVLDANSILIYPLTVAKQKDYQPMMVKTFFLSNIDVKTAANTLKNIVKAKDVVVDEKQNMLVMRDTPDAIRLAEKLLALHDLAEPEIMLEVAIVEITRSRLIDLGVQWPGQLSLSPLSKTVTTSGTADQGASTTAGSLTLNDLLHLRSTTLGATLSPAIVNVNQRDGDVKILANPRIRARNREVAKIMIGDRIPNITSTATATGFVSENIQYVDIGLKLEVQPIVYADNEVSIKIALEVSNVVNQVQTKSGSLAYQIGARNASTLLRLKDGENQVLAGLIRNDESSTGNGLPFLSDVPLIGRLFGSRQDNASNTEILLSITPRLIRNARRAEVMQTEYDIGTDASLKLRSVDGAGPALSETSPVHNYGSGKVPPQQPKLGSPQVGGPALRNTAPTVGTSTRMAWRGPRQAKVGSTFTLQLSLQPGEPITTVPFAVNYDPKVLEVVDVTEGDFLRQGGSQSNFSHRIDNAGGLASVSGTRTGPSGAALAGTVASLTFRALAAAPSASLRVSGQAVTGVGDRVVETLLPPPYVITISP